eukprot:4281507-Pleurochrysis_carterae.AAC.3
MPLSWVHIERRRISTLLVWWHRFLRLEKCCPNTLQPRLASAGSQQHMRSRGICFKQFAAIRNRETTSTDRHTMNEYGLYTRWESRPAFQLSCSHARGGALQKHSRSLLARCHAQQSPCAPL